MDIHSCMQSSGHALALAYVWPCNDVCNRLSCHMCLCVWSMCLVCVFCVHDACHAMRCMYCVGSDGVAVRSTSWQRNTSWLTPHDTAWLTPSDHDATERNTCMIHRQNESTPSVSACLTRLDIAVACCIMCLVMPLIHQQMPCNHASAQWSVS